MPSDEAGGQPDEGWKPEEKGLGTPAGPGGGDAGQAGEAEPKGRPSNGRMETEEAAAENQKQSGEGQPS